LNLLTRTEELILLAVWRLREKAYSVEIRKYLKEVTASYWSFGAVYMPLDRMVKQGYLVSSLADPTPQRGGRSKRIYRLTPAGMESLSRIKKMQKTIWEGLPEPSIEELK